MVSCLVISHGNIAQSYLEACKHIIGECENLFTLDSHALAPKALYQNIIHLIETHNIKEGLYILVSLKGGSCWNVAAKIAKEYDKVELISGLNLSILLSFITKCNQYSFHQLGEILLKDGIRGISKLN